jgi:hypothetical protein
MSTTANDLINGSLRLIGMLAEGEVPSSETSNDALTAMNQMIDSWSAERLSVFTTQDQTFTWPSNTISRTLGPSGNFVGLRPVQLDDSTYFLDATTGISYGIKIINQQQYNGIAVKTVTSTYPQVIWLNPEMPDLEMFIYPVPTRALEWHFVSVQELSQPAALATVLSFPPGYLRAFRYNLAVELSSEFGIDPSKNVARIAMASKRVIKRVNNPDDLMSIPYSIIGTRQRFNIYAGNF